MCGIIAAFGVEGLSRDEVRRLGLKLSKVLRHRGPDASTLHLSPDGKSFMAHERLNIVDASDNGRQPFKIKSEEGDLVWMLNSEIYNHKEQRANALAGAPFVSQSDSELLGHWYQKDGEITNEVLDSFDGIFACVLSDERTGDFVVARDAMGICPLYWGTGVDGSMWFASEMKALKDVCATFEIFPPGHVYRSKTGTLERWYNRPWINDPKHLPSGPADFEKIHDTLVAAVVKRLMSDAPLGVLLSGGLDSSLVASIASKHMTEQPDLYSSETLHTFSIGMEGSPDLIAAQKVADMIGTVHHGFTFTVQEGLDALFDVIWHIESYEQIRASVPMYILSRKIKALGYKVVLSGEGADEVYGGYLYFHKAPDAEEFHRETVRKTTRLHQWDVCRANKSTFAFGLEARVPFLDKAFLDLSFDIDPKEKMIDRSDKPDGVHPRMEKYLIRKAFDTPDDPYLPEEVLWRQKEQFSDGVGYDWVDGLKEYAEEVISDEHWAARHVRFPEDTPMNKEYYLLRSLFEERFPGAAALNTVPKGLSIACSTPEAVAWDPTWANIHDISGRAVSIHEASEGYETATDDDSSGMPQDDLGGTSAPVGNNGNGNGVTKAAQRTVTPSALRQPLQLRMRTMHVPQPRVRARGSAMLSANKAGRIGLRLM